MTTSKSSSSKKTQSSSMKQSKLAFSATKPGPSAGKGKKPMRSREASISSSAVSAANTDDEAKPSPALVSVPVVVQREELDLQDKAGKYRALYGRAREKMGNIPPVHGEGQTKFHHILRVFDDSHEYGPCVGLTRLERWERASAMGLNPPPQIRDILLTRQGVEESEFSQTVFYGEV